MWRFTENGYGVASFTHINVSKYNYCFSDFPYPEKQAEFMHHKQIYDYVKAYTDKHKLLEYTKFYSEVILVEEMKEKVNVEFKNLSSYDKLWKVTVRDLKLNEERVYVTPYVSVCTGHHATPRMAEFPGQDTFTGEIIHSVKYKDAKLNKMCGKKVLLVGIGNSSVDIADNLVTQGE